MSANPLFKKEGPGFVPEVYDDLRRIAAKYLRMYKGNHTLQPTALVNEALMTFAGKLESQWESRSHFQACAARMMRWILLDHAKAKKREKRGGGNLRVSYNENLQGEEADVDVILLDQALQKLERENARHAKVVELLFFGGMTIQEVAEAMEISAATVKRDWKFAQAWLHREFSESSTDEK